MSYYETNLKRLSVYLSTVLGLAFPTFLSVVHNSTPHCAFLKVVMTATINKLSDCLNNLTEFNQRRMC